VTRLAIVLSVIGMALCAASPATAARSEFFGIVQGHLDEQDLQGLAAAGIGTERFELGWRSVEPSRGSFHWGNSDRFIGALAARGIRPFPFVWMSPRWIASSPARPPIDTAFHRGAWRNFLKAAVARYGRGGSYWTNGYPERYGADATPLPVQSWQVWNEPNLKKYFDPEGSSEQSPGKYARLLRISHDAIKSQDSEAEVVLAGNPGYPPSGGLRAWDFLDRLYSVGAVKGYFDAAALHPYSQDVEGLRLQIQRIRAVMRRHNDQGTPLWLTELGWGSAPPDRFGINRGLEGQERMLRNSFQLILNNRGAWRVERLFWFLWRDPRPGSAFARRCSFCGSAGVLRHDRTRKPAFWALRARSAETTPPGVPQITGGPIQGSFINDSTPGFSFASGDPSAVFACRIDATPFRDCGSPYALPQLSDGAHTFRVKAIDAPGNESPIRSRSFTVDTVAPPVTISSGPAAGQPSSDPSPSFGFTSGESGANLSCQLDGGAFQGCSSPFTASGLTDGSHTFRVRATDAARNTGVAARTWIVDTTDPTVEITSGPPNGSTSPGRNPQFQFSTTEPDVSFECQLGGGTARGCSSPFAASRLPDGSHTFQVTATDAADNTATASRTWTVDGPAEVSITAGPASGSVDNDRTPSFRFSSLDANPTFSCRVDGAAFRPCASPFTTPALADGLHAVRVQATDTAQGTDIDRRWFKVDTAAPAVRIKGQQRVQTGKRRASATFVLKPSERAHLRCRINSRPYKPCSRRYRTPKLYRGTHRLKVRAVDRAGNARTKGKTFKIVRR
jgi:hypothetical protein